MKEANLYSELGRLIVAFNAMEDFLAHLIRDRLVIEGDTYKDAICASMSFGQKLDFLCALEDADVELPKAERDRRIKVLCDAKKIEEERNSLVHAQYGKFDSVKSTISRRKATTRGMKGVRIKVDELDLEKLEALNLRMCLWPLTYFGI